MENSGETTTPKLVFEDLAKQLGASALDNLQTSINDVPDRFPAGFCIEDEEENSWAITVHPDKYLTFRYRGWGPYTLSNDVVASVIESTNGTLPSGEGG